MALDIGLIDFIAKELLPQTSKNNIVSLARQQVSSDYYEIKNYLENNGFNINLQPNQIITSKEIFESFGFKNYDDIDFSTDDGCNIIHDMNIPIPEQYHNKYDLVFECGTLEHIFDVKTVFENIIKMTKVDGYVCHISPFDWLNHGFYNFSLTIFYDVYRVNGFDNMKFYIIKMRNDFVKWQVTRYMQVDFVPSQIGLEMAENEYMLIGFIAQKKKNMKFQIPIQAAYDPALKLNTNLRTST